jgi:hypothetical protein
MSLEQKGLELRQVDSKTLMGTSGSIVGMPQVSSNSRF